MTTRRDLPVNNYRARIGNDGRKVALYDFKCCRCDRPIAIEVGNQLAGQTKHQDGIERLVRQRLEAAGWTAKAHLRHAVCKRCNDLAAARKGPITIDLQPVPAVDLGPTDADFLAVASLPPRPIPPARLLADDTHLQTIEEIEAAEPDLATPPTETDMSTAENKTAAADSVLVGTAPMSIVSNNAIVDALEIAYDRKAGRYKGDGSDQAIGKRLNVPHALVGQIRSLLFGNGDGNETDSRADELAAAAIAKADEADRKIEEAMALTSEARKMAEEARRLMLRKAR